VVGQVPHVLIVPVSVIVIELKYHLLSVRQQVFGHPVYLRIQPFLRLRRLVLPALDAIPGHCYHRRRLPVTAFFNRSVILDSQASAIVMSQQIHRKQFPAGHCLSVQLPTIIPLPAYIARGTKSHCQIVLRVKERPRRCEGRRPQTREHHLVIVELAIF